MTLVIPGVETVHERWEWEEVGYRMAIDFTRLPTRYVAERVTKAVAHYTGAMNVPDGDAGEDPHDIAGWLRRAEKDYLTNRTGGGYVRRSDGRLFPGYHLGYSFGVDWLGGVWEIRGFDFLPAATNQHNGYTIPILFYVDGADPPTDLQWASARAIAREARARSGRSDFSDHFTDHGSLYITTHIGTPTACAGAGIRSELQLEGWLDFDLTNPPAQEAPKMATLPNPIRVVDTRQPPWSIVQANGRFPIILGPRPTWAGAAIVRIGVDTPAAAGFLTAWNGQGDPPSIASHNYRAGDSTGALVHVPCVGSSFTIYTSQSTHLIVEHIGWDSLIA